MTHIQIMGLWDPWVGLYSNPRLGRGQEQSHEDPSGQQGRELLPTTLGGPWAPGASQSPQPDARCGSEWQQPVKLLGAGQEGAEGPLQPPPQGVCKLGAAGGGRGATV